MKVYLILAESLGYMNQWNVRPISIYKNKDDAKQVVANLNKKYNDHFTIKEMELK